MAKPCSLPVPAFLLTVVIQQACSWLEKTLLLINRHPPQLDDTKGSVNLEDAQS